MISRPIAGIAVAVAAVLLGCSVLIVGMLGGGGASANCLPVVGASQTGSSASPSGGASAAPEPIGEWNAEQVANAAVIVAVGQRLQVPARGKVIAVATAMQESSLTNLAGGDRDSVGLFQQRPSQGWGTSAQLQDPQHAATKFYTKLLAVPGWQTMPLTRAAQAVQVSAYPDAYAKFEPEAVQVVGAVGSALGLAIPSDLGQCASTCVVITVADTGSCVEAATVFGRAQSWLTAWSGGPVPYLSSGNPADWFHGYRRDCSGYVSMALGLDGPGLNTAALAARSTIISKADLRPGDLLINTAPNLRGHVVLFDRWMDASMSRYYGYEQSGDAGTHHRIIPYPYFGDYPMLPYRFGK
ncbi:hypothetical protein [Actinoplanes sp. NPDC026623]|uniref:hypothetical protein n=1 Tax=Actinoplanes sp. NPDC026623 TaxID=3155610 RepID=UPI0033CED47B